jgi:hypothetical protein
MVCKKIDKIIGISFIFFWIIYIIKIYVYTGLTSTESIESQILLIKILKVIFLTISLLGLIILGIKKIEYKKAKTWIRPFIGTVIILLLFFMNLSLENRLEALTLNFNEIEKIEKKLNDKNISYKDRKKWSKIYAKYQYIQNGKRVEYLLEDNYILYKPTKEEITISHEKSDRQADIKNIHNIKYYWLLLLFISIFLGILTRFGLFSSFLSCEDSGV